MIPTPILKLVGALLAALAMYGYIHVLQADNKALEASVELYKQQSAQAVAIANENTQKYLELQERSKLQNEKLLALQNSIDKIKEEQHSSEKEIIKYVASLPEGFEKSCLNMSVNPSISGVSN
jgi:hypothetical protein